MSRPLEVVRRIGDKLIRDTPFQYRLGIAAPCHTLDRMHFVDFGRTLGLQRPATAYAWTRLTVAEGMKMTLEIEHNDGCYIWLNGELVYQKTGDRDIGLHFDERSLVMPHEFEISLKPGVNTLLVKSETRGNEWRLYLQPPSTKGAVVGGDVRHPRIGLHGVANVDAQVAGLSNWLVAGPFPNPSGKGGRTGLDIPHGPELEFRFGRMYPGLDGPVTWTIPKVEALGGLIDPLPWGTNYHWNYHNGGVAWAMQHLTDLSGDPRYANYASRFCDFHLDGIAFVRYQVKTLNAVDSANHFIIDTPLLDFTLAPSLPFINRLRTDKEFPNRERYETWIANMLHYAKDVQIRLPGHGIFTRTTPVEYTTWVDDMFMGIPFLVQAALYAPDEESRRMFFDDAAHQVLEFNTQVWNPEARLYMHARYSGNPVKLPHWSRSNGWASWAMSEVLTHLPDSHPLYQKILAHFQTHCASLIRYQSRSGLWPNVLNRPDSTLEVSGTAIFVMAMARGLIHGWLDEKTFRPVVENGWQGLLSQVEDDGTVHAICMGTMCTEDEEYYVNRPFFDNDTHGLFAVLFAGIEMERLLARTGGTVPHLRGASAALPSSRVPART